VIWVTSDDFGDYDSALVRRALWAIPRVAGVFANGLFAAAVYDYA
jgi:hypothetical protein